MDRTYCETRLTRFTRETHQQLLHVIDEQPCGGLALDVCDPQGEIGHVVVLLGEDGHHYAARHTPDPRDLHKRLKHGLRIAVRWADGKLTWPCSEGIVRRNGTLRIL